MDIKKIDKEVNKAVRLIRRGYNREYIIEKINSVYFDREKIFEIAKCRIKARKKFGELAEKLFFDEEGLRYATPPIVADYRARRIKGDVVADICCGVGMQLIYFSKYAEKAVGVEIDCFRAKLAMLNAVAMDAKIKIIKGDALSKKIFDKINADCIFCDPSRKEKEEKRKFETLLPNPMKVYSLYSSKTDRIAFELPPQISREEIKIEGEKEYTSLNFNLNRLALYTGELAECDTSAVSLPSEERITDLDEKMKLKKTDKALEYIYEVDRTIIKAGLLENLTGKIGFNGYIIQIDKRRGLLTSSSEYKSAFLRKYEVVAKCNFDYHKLNRILKKLGARKATLRFSVEPEKYWEIRKKIEEGLEGEKHFYIFKVGNKVLVAKQII